MDFTAILDAIKNFGMAVLTVLGFKNGKLDVGQLLWNLLSLGIGFMILVVLIKKLPSLL